MSAPAWKPGDLDRMAWAVAESPIIDTESVTENSGVPRARARAALDELVRVGRVAMSEGHHHANGEFCQCNAGRDARLPRMLHWTAPDWETDNEVTGFVWPYAADEGASS